MSSFDLAGTLRRIRRRADLSQRELAERVETSKSAIARAESGRAGMDVRVLAAAAAVAGLRLAIVDTENQEIAGMSAEAVRDMAGRRYPAHLDTRYGDESWWHDAHHYGRERPWYTFDRSRRIRDAVRAYEGIPDDHQSPMPGDSPAERAAARRTERLRAAAEEHQRRFLAGEFRRIDDWFECECPTECDELDDCSGKPIHAPGCSCDCDLA